MPLDKYYTLKEVSETTGLSERALRTAISKGRLVAFKGAKHYMVTEEQINEFIESRTVKVKRKTA